MHNDISSNDILRAEHGTTYLPNLEIEVKSEASWFAVEGGEEGEEKGGNFMHLLQVGRVLDGGVGEQAQAKLLPKQVHSVHLYRANLICGKHTLRMWKKKSTLSLI